MKHKERIDFRDQISRNKAKSLLLIIIIFIVFIAFGYVISIAFDPGYFFVIMAISVVFSISYLLFSYYNSHKIAIASVRARKASRQQYKEYYDLVESLCLASGLPMPKLYVMESSQINAFASGRNPKVAVICITQGCFEKLNREELRGVLAHELSHVANYDIRFITLAAVAVGLISIVSELFLRSLWFSSIDDDKSGVIFIAIGLVLAIVAPIFVYFVQMAISRKREYAADASAVKFTRYPKGLIDALRKIGQENYVKGRTEEHKIPKAVAPLFFASPFKELGSTHPPLEKRISALERM